MADRLIARTAVISTNTTGDNTLIVASVGKTIFVWQVAFTSVAGTNLIWKDGATALSGAFALLAGGTFTLQNTGMPWYQTTEGNALILNQSGTSQLSGTIYYTFG